MKKEPTPNRKEFSAIKNPAPSLLAVRMGAETLEEALELRLPTYVEGLIEELKKTLLQIKDVIGPEEWDANVKGQAEGLIAAIMTAYVNTHMPAYYVLEDP